MGSSPTSSETQFSFEKTQQVTFILCKEELLTQTEVRCSVSKELHNARVATGRAVPFTTAVTRAQGADDERSAATLPQNSSLTSTFFILSALSKSDVDSFLRFAWPINLLASWKRRRRGCRISSSAFTAQKKNCRLDLQETAKKQSQSAAS